MENGEYDFDGTKEKQVCIVYKTLIAPGTVILVYLYVVVICTNI